MLRVVGTTLSCGDRQFRCAIGKGGFSADKREGDGATPLGVFALRECWYRADRLAAPDTKLPLRVIAQNDGWCDDPKSAEYNRHVTFSSPIRGEAGRGADDALTYPLLRILNNARDLRKTMTDAEQLLWRMLRGKQMGVKFRKQHPVGAYIADFACLDPKLIIELDGGQHSEENAVAYDDARRDFLEQQGFRVLRYWNNDVLTNTQSVLETIYNELHGVTCPHPNPPPLGEGISAERLFREEHVYDVIVPLGYNDDPPLPGRGSAIFLHVAKPDYAPTEGCVALALPDLLEVLALCDNGTVMEIRKA